MTADVFVELGSSGANRKAGRSRDALFASRHQKLVSVLVRLNVYGHLFLFPGAPELAPDDSLVLGNRV